MRSAQSVAASAQTDRKGRDALSSPASSSVMATVAQIHNSARAVSPNARMSIKNLRDRFQNPSSPSPAPASSAESSALPAYSISSSLPISP